MAGHTERINGADLSYEVHGDPTGRRVLLLHGGIGSAEDWVDGAKEELIAPDQPAKMATPIPGAELTIMPGTGRVAPFD